MSNFCADTGGRRWCLVQVHSFSRVVGRRALQTNVTGVCGEHSQCSAHTGFAPARGVCTFPVYTAQAPGCSIGGGPCVACGSSFWVLHKRADLVGPAFCGFPSRSSSGSQELDECTRPGAVSLIPSMVPASVSAPTCWVRLVSVLGSWSLAATLPADVNHPESQEVFG